MPARNEIPTLPVPAYLPTYLSTYLPKYLPLPEYQQQS